MTAAGFHAVGIDVGGTKIAAGCVRFPEGVTLFRRVIPTSPQRGGEAVLEDVALLADEVITGAGAAGVSVGGIGLGLCELVSPEERVLSENSIKWRDVPVHERLSRLAPFTLEADVRAAALAEARFGAGRGLRLFLYLTVGTGISCCLMMNGEPFVGTRGATGTMASSPVSVLCERCGHLNQRSLEELAAGPGLVARLNERRAGSARSGQEVLASALGGEPDALAVARTGGEALGAAVGWLVNVLDPEALVVGGGLGLSEGIYWDSFRAATRRHIWSEVHRDLPILRAMTGVDAGLIGAAAVAWKRATEPRIH
jgi:glucokinase